MKLRLAATLAGLCGFLACASGQSFNIDIDTGSGDPGLGGGAPSAGFAGAADQPGYWNELGYGGDPQEVRGLHGGVTSVAMSAVFTAGSALGFRFEANTGDYALLLNDAASVGSLLDGGEITYTFAGLNAGSYEIYTYAVNVVGFAVNTPVRVPGAFEELQIVTGPMPGNSFQYLVTHGIHRIDIVAGGSFDINIVQPPNLPQGMYVNGFQVVLVAEPTSAVATIFGIAILLCRSKNKPVRLDAGRRRAK